MATVSLAGVGKSYGSQSVVRDINLDIADGEFVVLVGPSGCGKSTILRMIAGLEDITHGEISIAGEVVNGMEARERNLAMVFQDYALYPNMTVEANIGFGLKMNGVPAAERRARVREVARLLQIEPYLERKPRALSGGQRQRVAMGRALARKARLFLFDEPLSNLDAALRTRTRVELARLHQRLKTTMVFVTHDQVEAMTLATRIVVMNGGCIEQVGSPIEIYRRPATRFVAGFIGTPAMNFLAVERSASDDGFAAVCLPDGTQLKTAIPNAHLNGASKLTAGVRAESLLVDEASPIRGRADVVERLGERTLAYVTLADGNVVVAEAHRDSTLCAGEHVGLRYDASHVHLFDEASKAYHAQ